MKAELTLNKKSLLYGALTTLAFLGIAATLYFSSSKQSMQVASFVFAAASIFAGLTMGLITHCCAEPSQAFVWCGSCHYRIKR